jgi:DNA mismatch repair protein MutS2
MNEPRQSLDLLYDEPQTRIRLGTLGRALGFAFSAGDTSGLFERALAHSTAGKSSFDPACFSDDLFLDQFLDRCLPTGQTPLSEASKAYVKRTLCSPPTSKRTTLLRHAILRELAEDTALCARFERVYEQTSQLRALLEATDAAARYDINQRRIDVLRKLRDTLVLLSEGFADCRSALDRLASFGVAAVHSEGFGRLQELLSYEENLATLDLRVQVGIDGRLRSFQLLDHVENRHTRFYRSWFGRLWQRLWMAVRGYRVSQQELAMRLTDHVFEGLRTEVLQLFQLLGDMDFYRAGLGLYRLARGQSLMVCLPSFDAQRDVALEGLWNPFLVAEKVHVRVCDVRQSDAHAMTIITGPNSGGKTRLLQAIALCQLLGQAGLPVPARSANLRWATGMFVSIVQETSADQREGRLGTELLRIRHLFERIAPGDMIVLDELCSGTNPSEGEEIFRLVIQLLSELHPQLWLTTHFLQFAARLREEATVEALSFLQVELDSASHPTFQFVPGVAKSSLAGRTAERLGVTWQELSALVAEARRRANNPSNE